MGYRYTDFGNAETEQLEAKASQGLYAVQAALVRVKQHLDQGHLEEGFKAAESAESRLTTVADLITRAKLTSYYAGLRTAQVQVKRMWSRFDAMSTGRSSMRGSFGDPLDTAGQLVQSGSDKLAYIRQEGQKLASLTTGAISEGTALFNEAKDTWNSVKSIGGPAQLPDGTPYPLPTCSDGTDPVEWVMQQAYGIGPCGGRAPAFVMVKVGDSPATVRAKVQGAISAGGFTPLQPASADPRIATALSRGINTGAPVGRYSMSQSSNSGGLSAAVGGIGLGTIVGLGLLGAKLLMK